MGSMLPYIAAPWIRHGSGTEINGIGLSAGIQMDYPLVNIQKAIEHYHRSIVDLPSYIMVIFQNATFIV